jgi:hypothetical protein
MSQEPQNMKRRQLLQALVALGITAPAAADLLASGPPQTTVDTLRSAEVLLGEDYSPERLDIIQRALQRNLDEFQIVRDLVIDDLVEPAPIFMAKGR